MFRDEAQIEVIAGDGGDGIVSFRREKYVEKGGPDGGDGGHGGDVVLIASTQVHSLLEIGRSFRYAAQHGERGGSRNKTGRSGESIELLVPVGTIIKDAERGNVLRDLDTPDARLVVAVGGKGGKGNTRFASSVRQVPRHATPGIPGEHRRVLLELKLFAQVGLLGFPNAGKSTFLSRVSAARPKIADYPFTTLEPQVGIVPVGDYDTLVMADLPGLIEGAAEGAGLGHRFLRHVERCRVLLHLVDVSTLAEPSPAEAYRLLDDELRRYSAELYAKPRIVVATKAFEDDDSDARVEELAEAVRALGGGTVLGMSSVLGTGVPEVLRAAREVVRAATDTPA
ncbi:MAG: GTPase ObgE [Planctomycetota bacterium]